MADQVQPGGVTPQPFSKQPFYEEVARELLDKSPKDVAEAVLCTLARKLPGGVALQMENELPSDLVQLIMSTCPVHQQDRALPMSAEEFYEKVGAHFDADAREGRRFTRVVFRALQPYLSKEVSKKIATELPKELQELWNETRRERGLAV